MGSKIYLNTKAVEWLESQYYAGKGSSKVAYRRHEGISKPYSKLFDGGTMDSYMRGAKIAIEYMYDNHQLRNLSKLDADKCAKYLEEREAEGAKSSVLKTHRSALQHIINEKIDYVIPVRLEDQLSARERLESDSYKQLCAKDNYRQALAREY
jgi:hypothetical protein